MTDRVIFQPLNASWGAPGRYRASVSNPTPGKHPSAAGAPLAKTRAPFKVSHPMGTDDARRALSPVFGCSNQGRCPRAVVRPRSSFRSAVRRWPDSKQLTSKRGWLAGQ